MLIEAVMRHAEVAEAEVVGLPPAAAFDGFPDDLPVRNRRTLEEALAEDMARRLRTGGRGNPHNR
jgi:hypothetical protein